jgi:arylsulfatase A-like enzyme
VRNRYQNSILYADSLVQRVLDALREAGRLERTIVVVTGDHGEEFWESGSFGHGYGRLSPQQCEVPLLMRVPGGPTSTRYTYSSHADIFPTLFDAMGLEAGGRAFMSGKSLLRYEPSLDLAVSGFGITGEKVDERLLAEGDGLAVHWIDEAPFVITEVTALDGSPLAAPAGARADDLVFRALASKGLR